MAGSEKCLTFAREQGSVKRCGPLNLQCLEQNQLYPVFLKVSEFKIGIVGGGAVGLEKLHFLLKSSPSARVQLISREFLPELVDLAEKHGVELLRNSYDKTFLQGKQLVIAATDDTGVNLQVHRDCKEANILVNVADNPPYCDFYMGGIVTRGNLKLAISTNGKSPTAAKRIRQFFEEVLPEGMEELLSNLSQYREMIQGDLSERVSRLNALTRDMIRQNDAGPKDS